MKVSVRHGTDPGCGGAWREIMGKHARVELTADERRRLERALVPGAAPQGARIKAHILLLADRADGRKALTGREIAGEAQVCRSTVSRVCRRYVAEGLDALLGTRSAGATHGKTKASDAIFAALSEMTREPPPEGGRWTLRGLAGELVRRGLVESVSEVSVHNWMRQLRARAPSPPLLTLPRVEKAGMGAAPPRHGGDAGPAHGRR